MDPLMANDPGLSVMMCIHRLRSQYAPVNIELCELQTEKL